MKNKPTETKFKSARGVTCYLISRVVCLGAVILACSSAWAQNLFVSSDAAGNISDSGYGKIYEFTPGGKQSTFASGLDFPFAMTCDSAGNLFVANVSTRENHQLSGAIYKFTPGGVQSPFASGLIDPDGLAFDSMGNLF